MLNNQTIIRRLGDQPAFFHAADFLPGSRMFVDRSSFAKVRHISFRIYKMAVLYIDKDCRDRIL
ncbi:MAG TPA: hypothetical protein DCG37_02105 [Lachnospiraceae bacterium]|nr:hypothetical protein [Lachnospiraceae bacterium]